MEILIIGDDVPRPPSQTKLESENELFKGLNQLDTKFNLGMQSVGLPYT